MKNLYLSIFWKLLISILLTVSVFAFLNITLVWEKVFNIIDSEISNRIINIGKNLANQSLHYILYKDISSLQYITDNTKRSDSIIEYCFILDFDNKVLAHTFSMGFPKKLLEVNKCLQGDTISTVNIRAENFSTRNIKDIMIPIMDGKVGSIRIGINNDISWFHLKETFMNFIMIFLLFTLIGFLGAFVFSYLITKPIKKIKSAAEVIDIDNIETNKLIQKRIFQKNNLLSIIHVRDEIDDLTDKFNEMIIRLDSTYSKLISAQHAINQSEKLASIGTLVSGLAHEINNPLSGMQSCIRRIIEQPENTAQNLKYIKMINEASVKIHNVVNGLLDFSRASSGIKTKNDILKIIENTVNLIKYRKLHFETEIIITKEINDFYMECNKNEMEQVFFNLLKNSVDAIEEKLKINGNHKGEIEIVIRNYNSSLEIIIVDNGIGIANDNINKVFDPFFTTKEVGKGTGLGCSICYNIIKDHNGEIHIESEYMKWTKVKLNFKCN